MAPLIWLITGCSSGIGEQLAISALARGDKVIATGRVLSRMQGLDKVGAALLQLDITSSESSVKASITKAIDIHGRIDVLVNNAGYILAGPFEDLSSEDIQAQFDTNVFGTLKVTRALLPHFRQRRAGTMIFLSSLSGWIGHPGCTAYAGSKFALEGIVEGLAEETREFQITTLLIEPGRFRTKFLSNDMKKIIPTSISDYSSFSEKFLQGLAKEDMNQPGNPNKLVEIICDFARKEGIAFNQKLPFRLPLGSDCYDDIKTKCEATLNLLKEWETVCRSTDYSEEDLS